MNEKNRAKIKKVFGTKRKSSISLSSLTSSCFFLAVLSSASRRHLSLSFVFEDDPRKTMPNYQKSVRHFGIRAVFHYFLLSFLLCVSGSS